MRYLKSVCIALMLLSGTASGLAADESPINIHASGFPNDKGRAVAKLYRDGDDVLGPARWLMSANIEDGQAEFQFPAMPHGAYALMIFHDENENGTLDHNVLRIPKEALGFSNGFTPGLISGMPSFDKLRFMHASGAQRIQINMK